MRTTTISIGLAACLVLAGLAQAQPSNPAATPPAGASQTEPGSVDLEQLERKFSDTLTRAELKGRWCSIRDGVLGPEKEDQYSILGVSKLAGNLWLIQARIRYGQKDITAPIPVRVKWAGDTPVITVDNVPVPGSGTYSARVMIYGNTYAGTWTGGDHGGLLSGVISRQENAPAGPAKASAPAEP